VTDPVLVVLLRDMDQAEALSHAGERLLPHLERAIARVDEQQLLPVIRAAALIGGPRALNLIAAIAARPAGTEAIRDVRQAELTRARLYFDPRRYGELVFPSSSAVAGPGAPDERVSPRPGGRRVADAGR
jgi:hypothetical protein